LIEATIFLLLFPDVFSDGRFVSSDSGNIITSGPEMLASKILAMSLKFLAICIALLPLMKPTTCDTAYFGGMEISI
jgi:hypothetical protein